MYKALLLVFALFLLSGVQPSVASTPYTRAKAKGRVFVHRPYYKKYRGYGRSSHKGGHLFAKKKSKAGHSTIRTRRF